jgi:hypothetical protein
MWSRLRGLKTPPNVAKDATAPGREKLIKEDVCNGRAIHRSRVRGKDGDKGGSAQRNLSLTCADTNLSDWFH